MKLWLLLPVEGDDLWEPWYDKAFGFVIAAETEEQARIIAQKGGGDECGWEGDDPAWVDPTHSTCVELTADAYTEPTVVMRDFASA